MKNTSALLTPRGERGQLPYYEADRTWDDKMVERTLELHEVRPKAKTPHEQESIQRQIAATDKQIDALVHELYALTEEEIGVVEGEGI